MFRPVIAILALVLSSIALAAPAQAASYSVTLTASHADRDLGETLTLTGKASGSKAAKKKLTVQRSLAGGAWTTIGTVTTTSKKAYTYKHKVSAVGAQSFRVIAPKNGSTKAGTSPTRSITGWTWLNLTDQPHLTNGSMLFGTTAQVNEDTYERSIMFFSGSGARSVYWQLAERCDDAELDFALNNGNASTQSVFLETDDGGATASVQSGYLQGYHVVTSGTRLLEISSSGLTAAVQIVTPRAHCSVTRLPDPSL